MTRGSESVQRRCLKFMVAFAQALAQAVVASLPSGAGMGLLAPALTVVGQNSVLVARMGSATTSHRIIRQVRARLGRQLPALT
jgi:hypothetical protein